MIFKRGGVEVSLSEPDYAQLASDAVERLEKAAMDVARRIQEHAQKEWYERPGIKWKTGRTARAISVELRPKGDLIRAVVFGANVPTRKGQDDRPSYYVKPAGAMRTRRTFVRDRDEYWRLVSLWRKGRLPLNYEVWRINVEENRPSGLTKIEHNPGPGGSENWQVFVNQDGKDIAIASLDVFEKALQQSADTFIRKVKR